jgi:class 3 adenylate cyclase
MNAVTYRYSSLEDFLASNPLTVDEQLDDGWGASFSVKGREIHAAVLFCDITGFTSRTASLSPTETLIFVNNFITWISAEALRGTNGIVDKYIGDEAMVVFSEEFGCAKPFIEALHVARWMCEKDVLAYAPHIGIASGKVIVGYTGTPLRYNCSVFGRPVAIAARCAGARPPERSSCAVTFPAYDWGETDFEEAVPREKVATASGDTAHRPRSWHLSAPWKQDLKNVGEFELRALFKTSLWMPQQTAEERAAEAFRSIKAHGRFWPKTDEMPNNECT